MPKFSELTNIWSTIKEIDLRPLRTEAQRGVKIAIVGYKNTGRNQLAWNLRRDPRRSNIETLTPISIIDLPGIEQALQKAAVADLLILLIKADAIEIEQERELIKHWIDTGKKALVVINTHNYLQEINDQQIDRKLAIASPERMVFGKALVGDLDDEHFLIERFTPEIIELLPNHLLALGRQFPLFRVPICQQLISETCLSNATYAFSTGVAEIVPLLNVPLNVTDMFVLSKTQAFLVYKLGLVIGMSTRWQDYVREFGGVLGGGFFWRQIARQLVGLIPAWGIVPKVAVSYAGTYVIGYVVLQWYLLGRHVTGKQIGQLYSQAFLKGKSIASRFLRRLPRTRVKHDKPAMLASKTHKSSICPSCGKRNSRQANYCQYCGKSLISK